MSDSSRISSANTSRLRSYLSTITSRSGHVPYRSTLISVAVACLALGLIAISFNTLTYTVGGIAAGSTAAIAIATIANGSRGLTIGGILVLFGSLSIVAVLTVRAYTSGLLTSSLSTVGFITGFGLTRFRVDAFGDGALAHVTGVLLRITTVLTVLTVCVVVLRIDLSVFSMANTTNPLSELLRPTTASGTTVGFVILAWLVVAGGWILATILPPETAIPVAIQDDYKQIRSRLFQFGVAVIGVGSILLNIAYLASVETRILIGVTEPTVGTLLRSPLLRSGLFRLFALLVLLAAILLLAKSIGVSFLLRGFPWTTTEAAVTAGLFVLTVVASGPAVRFVQNFVQLPDSIGIIGAVIGSTATGLLAGILVLVSLSACFTSLSLLAGGGILPSQTAGPRIAMGGLFFAAVVGSVGGGSPLAVLLCVVAGIVVYDLGVFGSELTSDLRRPVSHRDGEFIHAGAMLLIGGVTLAGGLLINSLISAFNINSAEVSPIVLILIFMIVLQLSILYLKDNNDNYFFD